MERSKEKKPSKGRQRIEIKKIERSSQLQVTFSKRRAGIFKKAAELSVMCGADIAVIITSPGGKLFAFGSPSVDSVVDRFLSGTPYNCPTAWPGDAADHRVRQLSSKYTKAAGELEAEKEREKAAVAATARGKDGGGFWWDEPVDGLGLNELDEYVAALEVLKYNAKARADTMAAASVLPASSVFFDGAIGGLLV